MASCGERLTRISAEITDVKRVVVVLLYCSDPFRAVRTYDGLLENLTKELIDG